MVITEMNKTQFLGRQVLYQGPFARGQMLQYHKVAIPTDQAKVASIDAYWELVFELF